MASPVPVPFTNLALSLSGGGYRATLFHLGGMSFLNSVRAGEETLLDRVCILSTISGGSLTGVMYALQLARGGDFDDCFTKLYRLLEKNELVERALDKLNHPGKWKNKHKSRDVINAFAEVYNEEFFDGATFAVLYDNPTSHLTDIVFGASEFTSGIQFRFQEEEDHGLFGNRNYHLPIGVAKQIRLADAAAASSCFPGGFEPMIMPKDFGNGPDSAVDRAWTEAGYPTTGIMDGGVVDNEGIEGVRLAEARHATDIGGPFVGTYIVSDVSSEDMLPYVVPTLQHSPFKNLFTLGRLNLFAGVLLFALVALLFLWREPAWVTIAVTSLLTIIVIWFLVYLGIRSFFLREVDKTFAGQQLPGILRNLKYLLRTPIYILWYLAEFRASSVLKMVMDIFLRRIRRLQINALFRDSAWRGRLRVNNLYQIKSMPRDKFPPELLRVVDLANTMPTSLWFSAAERRAGMLDALIACGQLTLCFNLMEYGNRVRKKRYRGNNIWDELTEEQRTEINLTHDRIVAAWKRFREDPYWLLKEQKLRALPPMG